jgi:hypothetical protein
MNQKCSKAACESIIRNLRSNDQFALVVFDQIAEVVLPMGTLTSKSAWNCFFSD